MILHLQVGTFSVRNNSRILILILQLICYLQLVSVLVSTHLCDVVVTLRVSCVLTRYNVTADIGMNQGTLLSALTSWDPQPPKQSSLGHLTLRPK